MFHFLATIAGIAPHGKGTASRFSLNRRVKNKEYQLEVLKVAGRMRNFWAILVA
jgi:hypothetical protein